MDANRMEWDEIETELTALAERLDIEVRHVRYEGEGGLCLIRGKEVLAVNDGLDTPDRVIVMARALAAVPEIESVHMMPRIRSLLDKYALEG